MKFEEYELKKDKYGFNFVKSSIMVGEEDKHCVICGRPTKFIEVFSEQHMCSDECVKCFYEMYGN